MSVEYLLTTCKSNDALSLWNIDSQTGNNVKVYKSGGLAKSKTLDIIGNDFVLYANETKPLLHLWQINNQEAIKNIGLVLPDVVNTLAVSPDGFFISVGIGSKLFTWQFCSGELLSIQSQHLLPITCMKFSNDGDYLITGSQNGTVITYNFGDVIDLSRHQISQKELGVVTPLYVKNDSVGSITDIEVGSFSFKSRFVTVTNNYTAQLYELQTGNLLLKVIFEQSLSSVAMDAACWNLFFGFDSGVIRKVNLQSPPRNIEVHIDNVENKHEYVSHTKKVNCLQLTVNNRQLISGSDDNFVIIWDVHFCNLLNKIELKGPVTNLKLMIKNENFFSQTFKSKYTITSLKRDVCSNSSKIIICNFQNDDEIKEEGETRTLRLLEAVK